MGSVRRMNNEKFLKDPKLTTTFYPFARALCWLGRTCPEATWLATEYDLWLRQ